MASNRHQALYSIFQFCADIERCECANVGIALFLNDPPWVMTKVGSDTERIEKFFGIRLGESFFDMRDSMATRVLKEFGEGWHKNQLEIFLSMRAGKFRLTPLRGVLVEDPDKTIDSLYDLLVEK